MNILNYIKIKNFKIFGNNIQIDLGNPAVLIGPNNSGKTSVLQAFALWATGIKTWVEIKGNSKAQKRISTPINRMNLTQLPIKSARYLWNGGDVRSGARPIPLEITLGILFEDAIHDCTLSFTQNSSELIYCQPTGELINNQELLNFAASLKIDLLYSMSGIAIEETEMKSERVNYLIGQGLTSEVLRNLCYSISLNSPADWKTIVGRMNKLFAMNMLNPQFIPSNGTIELKYKTTTQKTELDIASSGRGALQTLLLLTYMYAHKGSVILLDEPDAHLEILRQQTIFALLCEVARVNHNQIIIATHSEVILNEAAETNLSMIINGTSSNLAKKGIAMMLKDYGVEHYYKASISRNILYIESSADILMFKAFAELLKQKPVVDYFGGNYNYYYTCNPIPDSNIDNVIQRAEGYYQSTYLKHFALLKSLIPDFIGVGIFDSDAKPANHTSCPSGLNVHYWTRYELENYFVTPKTINMFFEENICKKGDMFYEFYQMALVDTIKKLLFDNNSKSFLLFNSSEDATQELIWETSSKNIKMSNFLDELFNKFSEYSSLPIQLRKGEYWKLIQYLDAEKVDKEIIEVLDLLNEKLVIVS